MARTRSIKPGFFDNELLGSLTPLTRLLFIGLWTQADRAGRLEDRPRRIKKTVLGYDDVNAEDVDDMLQALADNGFILRYEVAGERYLQVVNFVKHQNPHMKEKPSELPAPDGAQEATSPPRERRQEPDEEAQEDTGAEQGAEGPPEAEDEAAGDESGEEQPKQSITERRFDLFWAAYPLKKSKEDARKVWKKLKPNEELFTTIMEAVARAKTSRAWTKEDGAYIPYPAKWLRAGGWEDEEGPNNGQRSGHPGRESTGRQQATPTASINGFKPAD